MSRSVSTPVSARTKAVFPWSMWPAVPAITFFIAALLLVSGAPVSAQDEATFRTGVADVRVDVQVLDHNRVIQNLTAQDFMIADSGRLQKIVYFGRESEQLSLVILLDISGSMQTYIDRIAATAREALAYLRPGDRVAILVFAKTAVPHMEFTDNHAEAARQIGTAVRGHDLGAGTAINLAVATAAEYLGRYAPPNGRRAILVLTDNLSLSYRFPDDMVTKALYQSDSVLNAIVVGRAIRPGPPKPGVYQNPDFSPADVFKLAEETGGDAVKADHPEISFREMIERIRTRYSLSYHAPESQRGLFHPIAVRLNDAAARRYPHAEVRARRGYYGQ